MNSIEQLRNELARKYNALADSGYDMQDVIITQITMSVLAYRAMGMGKKKMKLLLLQILDDMYGPVGDDFISGGELETYKH